MNLSTTLLITRIVSILAADIVFIGASGNPSESDRSRITDLALFILLNFAVNALEANEDDHRFAEIRNRKLRILAKSSLLLPTAVTIGSSWHYYSNTDGNFIALVPLAIGSILLLTKWAAYCSWSPEREEIPS